VNKAAALLCDKTQRLLLIDQAYAIPLQNFKILQLILFRIWGIGLSVKLQGDAVLTLKKLSTRFDKPMQ